MRKSNLLIIFISLFLTSFSVLTLEIIFAKIFSVLAHYHFSSMIISIALLGFGAAGAYVSVRIRREKLDVRFLGKNLLFFFVSIVVIFHLIVKIKFYPLSWDVDWTIPLTLIFLYLLMGIPFYFAGLVISSLFTIFPERANVLYFSDLIGAGIGCLGSVVLIEFVPAPLILHFVSIAGLLFLLLLPFFNKQVRLASFVFLSIFLFFSYRIIADNSYLVYPPPSKSMFRWVKPWEKSDIIDYSKWNIIEKLDVTKGINTKIWGFGGEISPNYRSQMSNIRFLFKDGIMSSGILKVDKDLKEYEFLSGYLMSAPYCLDKYNSVVIIGPGGGIELLIALYHGVKDVLGIELNPEKVEILKNKYYRYSGKLIDKCTLVPWEGRHFLSRWKGKADIIGSSGLDEYPALSSGAYAMSETYMFTVESIISMLNHLSDRGVITTTRLFFDPPRETLRLVVTMKEALRRFGVSDPSRYFVILKGKRWTNTLLKKIPFTGEEIENIKKWAEEMKFDFFYLPYKELENPIDEYLRIPLDGEKEFLKKYPYRVDAVTDNVPFFFFSFKWSNLFGLKSTHWTYQIMPVGLKIVIFSLIQITLFGVFFIGIPLLIIKPPKHKKWHFPLFFYASIGLGFILIEIVLIQKLNYFLGGPIYALAVTLFAVLTFSGFGSYFVRKKGVSKTFLMRNLGILLVLAFILFFGLNHFMNFFMSLNRMLRIFASIIVISPLAIFMGIPFPAGIKMLKNKEMQTVIPLAWGVNSIFTVLGSVLCLFISLNWGFNTAFLVGIGSYGSALLISSRL